MDSPGAQHLMETVRKIGEIGRRARSGAPSADDYLRALASDPTTEWFGELLREKNVELAQERERSDRLASALRTWHRTKRVGAAQQSADQADLELLDVLRGMQILNP